MPASENRDPLITLIESALHITRELDTHDFEDPRIVQLTPVERLVIQYVERSPGASLHDVAAGANLQVSNASAAIKRLVELGLVERSRDPEDGRRAVLWITDRAAKNLGHVHDEWLELVSGASVDANDLEAAVRVLAAIDDRIVAARRRR